MVDNIYSVMIVTIAIYTPPEDNAAIYRYVQIFFVLQRLDKDEVQNTEEKEQIIMRDGEIATMIQQQEEDEAKK